METVTGFGRGKLGYTSSQVTKQSSHVFPAKLISTNEKKKHPTIQGSKCCQRTSQRSRQETNSRKQRLMETSHRPLSAELQAIYPDEGVSPMLLFTTLAECSEIIPIGWDTYTLPAGK